MSHAKVNLASSDLSQERLQELYRIIPEAFSEGGAIDWEKLRSVLGDRVNQSQERFSFSWARKSEAIKNVIIPSKATLAPAKDESIKFEESENLFIEGDNLEVLKLLQKAYFEKVKMIYIDPPYNTGGDFVYKDDFSSPVKNYLEQTGQVDSNGNKLSTNRETSGRYHSDWLTMMYPRLKLAWNLLRDDGIIAVSIGDEEVAHLKIVIDEIFGEENFEGHIHWRRRHNQPNDRTKMIGLVAEHILVYAKNLVVYKESGVGKVELTGKFSNPDSDPRGDWASKPWKVGSGQSGTRYEIVAPTGKVLNEEWMGDEETYKKLLADNRIIFPNGNNGNGGGLPRKKYFRSEREEEGQCATNWWGHEQFGSNQEGTDELFTIFGLKNIFDNPKPVKLVENLLTIAHVKDDDVILDFFAGSGTTAHAVLAQNREDQGNRKFILVQLPEATDPSSEAYRAGFKTIADIAKERIRRVIRGYGDNPQPIGAGFKVFKLAESNYSENLFELDPEKPDDENSRAFEEYLERAKQGTLFAPDKAIDVVYENIIKEGLSLNSQISQGTIGQNRVFTVTDGERSLLICLDDKIKQETIKAFTSTDYKGKTFICLDTALDDTAKANLALNLELKTI